MVLYDNPETTEVAFSVLTLVVKCTLHRLTKGGQPYEPFSARVTWLQSGATERRFHAHEQSYDAQRALFAQHRARASEQSGTGLRSRAVTQRSESTAAARALRSPCYAPSSLTMTTRRKSGRLQLRRSISEQLRDSTAKAWDLLWRNVRERRLAGQQPHCPADRPAALTLSPRAEMIVSGARADVTVFWDGQAEVSWDVAGREHFHCFPFMAVRPVQPVQP
ncbi:hypothetical protein SRHO_G00223630 [Serrasalmus rhombeus]